MRTDAIRTLPRSQVKSSWTCMTKLTWTMHLGGDCVDTKRQRWEAGGWVPEEEGGCAYFRQLRLLQRISMPTGFPAAHLSVRSPKLRFVEYDVRCRKAGGEYKQLSNNNVYLTKANICREDKAAVLHLDPSSAGHSDKRWLGPHFPTATASVSIAISCRNSIPVCH